MRNISKILQSLRALLEDLYVTVEGLPHSLYADSTPVSQPIGSHVRHILDHVDALTEGAFIGKIEYDRRERGRPEESQPQVGLERIKYLQGRLALLNDESNNRSLIVHQMVSPEEFVELPTTLERELLFVYHHTVHHQAFIALILKYFDVEFPESMGYAPATIAAQKSKD